MHTSLQHSVALAVLSTACVPPPGDAPGLDGGAWIETWATAVTPPTLPGGLVQASPSFSDQTVRQVVRISGGGEAVRVRFTNEHGRTPLLIGGARLALADDAGGLIPGSEEVLTFGGRVRTSIPPGAPLVSDPVALAVDDLDTLSISLYLPEDTGPCTGHQVGLETAFVSPPGDHTAGVFEPEHTTQFRVFLAGVDVLSYGPARTVVAFGDSITDGLGSTPGANRRWPDRLAERLLAREDGVAWGVANAGISGNQLLLRGVGDAGVGRFDRDVLGRPGVTHVLLFEGINDIGLAHGASGLEPPRSGPPLTADDVIAGYEQLTARAHLAGIEVFGATLAPFEGAVYWTPEGEAVRQTVNDWIRTSRTFDGVLDFDAALRDPADPTRIAEGLHMGDFIHGNDAGYQVLADSIDLALFE